MSGPETPPPLEIVIPVFGAAPELERCLASVRRHTPLDEARLLIVLDGPQPPEVEAALPEWTGAAGPGVVVARPASRRGFAASVNDAIASSAADLVVLNSDTEVTSGWLARLRAAAYSAPEVATATPFTNSGTVCSLPVWLAENALPAGWTLDRFAELVERSALPQRPSLPTAVGFCMYMKRSALDDVGLLDAASYGLGYGEEVDWCWRAARSGWRHVLDDATFVFHAGQASFGAERGPRVRRAETRLRRLYPKEWRELARFIEDDPLAPVRQRILSRLGPAPSGVAEPPRVLHIAHGWPPWNHAGTELYAARLARWQAQRRSVSALARIAEPRRRLGDAIELLDAGVRVRLLVNNFTQRDPLSRAAIREPRFESALSRLIDEQRPDLVHVHHLAGLCATLPRLARRRGIPVVYQIQDWWTICARANLFDSRRCLCDGPGPGKCSRCLPLTALPPASLTDRLLHVWRRRTLRQALRSADSWVMGSRFIETSFRGFGLLRPDDPVHVLPYGVDPPVAVARQRPGPLRVGFIGSLLPHKGAHVAVAAFSTIDGARATLDIWGNPASSPAYWSELTAAASPSVRFRGSFAEGEETRVFSDLDVLLVPSLGLESYGLAAREAMAHGLFVVASRRGALAELPDDGRCALFDAGDAEQLREIVLRLAADRGWQRTSPPADASAPSLDRHAGEIERVYRETLARHSARR